MKHESSPNPKFAVRSVEENAQTNATAQSHAPSTVEFSKAEELVRHDRAQIAVPETLALRVEHTVTNLPTPSKPWWRRWF